MKYSGLPIPCQLAYTYDLMGGRRHRRVSPITGQKEPWHFRKGRCNHLVACPTELQLAAALLSATLAQRLSLDDHRQLIKDIRYAPAWIERSSAVYLPAPLPPRRRPRPT